MTIEGTVKVIVGLPYPNGVEFEHLQTFDGIVLRCSACMGIGLGWEYKITSETLMLEKYEYMGKLKAVLMEHAKSHNALVRELVKAYGLNKKEPIIVEPLKKIAPHLADQSYLTAEFLDEGQWKKLFEELPALPQSETALHTIQSSEIAIPGVGSQPKPESKIPEKKKEGETGRRISLSDEDGL